MEKNRTKKIKSKHKKLLLILSFIILLFGSMMFLDYRKDKIIQENTIDYPTFWELVDNDEVSKITIKNLNITISLKDGSKKYTTYPETPTFKEEVLKHKIEVKHIKSKSYVDSIIYVCVMAVMLYFLYKNYSPKNMVKSMELNTSKKQQNTTFKDVAGIDEAKDQLVEVVEYLKNPNKCKKMNIRAPKGVLLVGPPGTGKTLLAKAVAGEANVPFYSVTGSDFVQMFAGLGATRVRQLFAKAREHKACVIFIDEIDSMGKKRGSSGSAANDEKDQTLNALLTEMDGFESNSGIVVIAATNRLDILDPALLRAGRFDRHIEVSFSDIEGREEILKVHSKGKPLDKSIDLKKLARRTSGFSGADLENLMNESGWHAIRNNRDIILWEDIDAAFNVVLVGAKKKRNILSKKEKNIVAYHESGHALMTKLYSNIPIEKITITPTSKALGYVMRNEGDIVLKTKKEFMNDLCISLGGRIAEEIMFGEENVTNGASQDFENATTIAYDMVFSYGMSNLGEISIAKDSKDMWNKLSDDIKNLAYKEVQNIIEEARSITKAYLVEHKEDLEKLANYLLEHESMDGEDFDKLFDL